MRLPKIGSTIKYKEGMITEVKSIGKVVTLLEEGKKKPFEVPLKEFSEYYENGEEDEGGENGNGNGENIKDVYAACVAGGDEHADAVKNTAEKLSISEDEVEAAVADDGNGDGGENDNGGDGGEGDEEKMEMIKAELGDKESISRDELDTMLKDKGVEKDVDTVVSELGLIVKEDGNFGIPPQGQSTAVDRLPSVREFLAEKTYERKIHKVIKIGETFRLTGAIKNVTILEQKLEDKPSGEEGSKAKDDKEPSNKGKEDPEKESTNRETIDLDKGDDVEIQNIDPKNKDVIAKHGDKVIKLSTDDFVDKSAVLEKVNEEDETNFGDEISKINTWFEGDGGYTDADSFEWDGETLTITKEDGSTETKTRADLADVLGDGGGASEE